MIKKIARLAALFCLVLAAPLVGHRAHKHYIYDYKGRSVVRLTQGFSGGTGFRVKVASGKNYILTNYHICMLGYETGYLRAEDYNGNRYRLNIIKPYLEHDLCLVEDVPGIPALSVANGVYPHEQVYLVGHPRLANLTMESGSVVSNDIIQLVMPRPLYVACNGFDYPSPWEKSLADRGLKLCLEDFSATHANIIAYGGNSGSPVLDDFGNVIGVLFAGSNKAVTASYLVPLAHIQKFLAQF